jgi:hypothetical protein
MKAFRKKSLPIIILSLVFFYTTFETKSFKKLKGTNWLALSYQFQMNCHESAESSLSNKLLYLQPV